MNREDIHQILLDHQEFADDVAVPASMAESPLPPEIPSVPQEDATSPEGDRPPDAVDKPEETAPPIAVPAPSAVMPAHSGQTADSGPFAAPAAEEAGDVDTRTAPAVHAQAAATVPPGPSAACAGLLGVVPPRPSVARSASPPATPAVWPRDPRSGGAALPGSPASASPPGADPSSQPVASSATAGAEELSPDSVVAAPPPAAPAPVTTERTRPVRSPHSPAGAVSPHVRQDAASTGQLDPVRRRASSPSPAVDSSPAFPALSWTAPPAPAAAPLPSRASDQIAADIADIKAHTAEIARQGII